MTVSIAADLFATHTTKLKPMNLPANTNQSAWLKLKILFVLATCLGLPATTGLQAAAITWGAPTVIAADADVATTGTALYAYAGGLATASTNLNGVTFTQGSGFAAWGNVSFTAGFTASSATAFVVNAAPFNGLSGTYSNVLQGAAYVGTTAAGTVTLNGLTAGKSYAVQIWVNDPRSAGSGRAENASSTGGNTVTLDYNNFDAPGGVGQFVYGTFVADNTNQAFTLTPNPSTGGAAQLNAISVRDLGSSTKTWLGSGGTSWGTSANWSPSVVPIPGNTVLFNNTSVANLSTLLDVNYTLAALIVSNASPISRVQEPMADSIWRETNERSVVSSGYTA